MSDKTPLAELEEAVRERFHQHGQHGALAVFEKYVAAVHERLLKVTVEDVQQVKAEVFRAEAVAIASQLKPSEEINAEIAALASQVFGDDAKAPAKPAKKAKK